MKKLLFTLISLCLVGCTSVKEVIREVPIKITQTEYKTEFIHDSTYVHDSTYLFVKGDTVFKTEYKFKYIERRTHDTLITHDTIPQVINIETTKVVNKPQWWPIWLALGIVVLYFLTTKTKFVAYLKEFIKYIIKLFK